MGNGNGNGSSIPRRMDGCKRKDERRWEMGDVSPKSKKQKLIWGRERVRVSERRWDGRYDVLTLVCLVLASRA